MAGYRTLNNVLSVFQSIAERHLQIFDYGVGDNWEIGASNELKHVVLWVNPTLSSTPKGTNGYSATVFDINVRVFDLCDKSELNENEVLSDTLEILKDVVVELSTHPNYINGNFELVNDVSFDKFTEYGDEEVSGWETTMSIEIPNGISWCSTPINPIEGYAYLSLDDLIAYYKLENTVDSSGNNNNLTNDLTWTGTTFGVAKYQNGAQFNIVDNSELTGRQKLYNLTAPVSTNSTTTTGFSISTWIKWHALSNNFSTVWELAFTGERAIHLKYENQTSNYEITIDDGSIVTSTLYNTSPTLDQWYHVCYVQQPLTGLWNLYLDGVSVMVDTDTNDGDHGGVSTLVLGNIIEVQNSQTFLGTMDEFSYWGRALTPTEVTQLSSNVIELIP